MDNDNIPEEAEEWPVTEPAKVEEEILPEIERTKKKGILVWVVAILVFILIIFILIAVFKKPPDEKITINVSHDIEDLLEVYQNEVHEQVLVNMKACVDDCNWFSNPDIREECEDAREFEVEFTKALSGEVCSGNLGKLSTDRGRDIIDLNVLCPAILDKNCAVGGFEEDYCNTFFDTTQCAKLVEDGHVEMEDCVSFLTYFKVMIQALEKNDPSLCANNPPAFAHLIECQALVKNDCATTFDAYIRDLALMRRAKLYDPDNRLPQVNCDAMQLEVMQNFCNVDENTWNDFEDWRFGREHMG